MFAFVSVGQRKSRDLGHDRGYRRGAGSVFVPMWEFCDGRDCLQHYLTLTITFVKMVVRSVVQVARRSVGLYVEILRRPADGSG